MWIVVPHNRQPHPLGIGTHDSAVLGVDKGGDHHLEALEAIDVYGGDDRLGSGGSAVIVGSVGDFHAGQVADHRLVFENRLERTLADLWLVGGVGGVELAPAQERIHDGRHKMMIGPRPQETRATGSAQICVGQCLQLPAGLHL